MTIETRATRISIEENTICMSNISTNNSVYAELTDDNKMDLVRALLPKKFVLVEQEDLDCLLEDSKKLDALEVAGVDNWEGYNYAMEIMEEGE